MAQHTNSTLPVGMALIMTGRGSTTCILREALRPGACTLRARIRNIMLTYRGRTRMGILNLLVFGPVPLGVSMAFPPTPHPQSHNHHTQMNERVSLFLSFGVEPY